MADEGESRSHSPQTPGKTKKGCWSLERRKKPRRLRRQIGGGKKRISDVGGGDVGVTERMRAKQVRKLREAEES